MKSENLNFLEPSGPLQTRNGTALPYKIDAECALLLNGWSNYDGQFAVKFVSEIVFDIVLHFIMPSIINNVQLKSFRQVGFCFFSPNYYLVTLECFCRKCITVLREFVKFRFVTSLCLFVRMENLGSHWTDFHEM